MTDVITITPSVLKWARETIGYTKEEVVEKIKRKTINVEVMIEWEAGLSQPNYSQLKKIAKIYKRPIALFFFPEPPEELAIEQDFRSLPSEVIQTVKPKIRYLIRQAKVRLMDLQELHNNAKHEIFINNLKAQPEDTAKELAKHIRNQIGVSIEEQKGWNNISDAFEKWRNKIEGLGVWVFKESFYNKNKEYFGFCLYDNQFPIIYIHNGCSLQRQTFTLFHELAHILRNKAGIYFRNNQNLVGNYEEEEVFCNAFAGHFLLPDSELTYSKLPDDETIKHLADIYKVSFDVVLRKYLNRGLISSSEYKNKIKERQDDFRDSTYQDKTKNKGGDYYNTLGSYLGSKYTELVFNTYYQQRITQEQVADYFNLKLENVNNFEEKFHAQVLR